MPVHTKTQKYATTNFRQKNFKPKRYIPLLLIFITVMDNFNIKKFLIENKLTRLSEQDDEWEFEAGEEWNVTELGIGDHITPEM